MAESTSVAKPAGDETTGGIPTKDDDVHPYGTMYICIPQGTAKRKASLELLNTFCDNLVGPLQQI